MHQTKSRATKSVKKLMTSSKLETIDDSKVHSSSGQDETSISEGSGSGSAGRTTGSFYSSASDALPKHASTLPGGASAQQRTQLAAQNRTSFIVPKSQKRHSGYLHERGAFTLTQLRFASLGLYGRDEEKTTLKDCFKRWTDKNNDSSKTNSKKELIWISGASGTGKTALSETLEDYVVDEAEGFFVRGKFDLNLRDQPYSGIASACRELCGEIWRHPNEEDISQKLVDQLGAELEILINVIPVLEEVVDVQIRNGTNSDSNGGTITQTANRDSEDSMESQGAEEAKHRFNYAFRRFLRIIGSFGPMCMVLDDLQWTDHGSLELLDILLTDVDNPNLMIVGCYRSNEVDDSHILSKFIRDMRHKSEQCEFNITELSVGNLSITSINQMLSDLLSIDDKSQSLAEICHKKTAGNVFFLINYLSLLQDQDLLTYNLVTMKWMWDVEQIQASTSATENVVDLMRSKMNDLSEDDRQLLLFASCLGSVFDERLLHIVVTELHPDNAVNPSILVEKGFWEKRSDDSGDKKKLSLTTTTKASDSYSWIHDKIQEAAQSLLSIEEVQPFRVRVGEILANRLDEAELDSAIFVVVNLLNGVSISEIDDSKKLRLAKLNLQAARKAKALSAFSSSAKYARKGIEALPTKQDVRWGDDYYDLSLLLYTTALETEACVGEIAEMEDHCKEVLDQTDRPILDKLRAHYALLDSLSNQHRPAEAMEHCLDVLKQLDCHFPSWSVLAVGGTVTGMMSAKSKAKNLTDEMFYTLPSMQDRKNIEAMTFKANLAKFAYMTESPLFPFIILRMLKYTLKYGICKQTPTTFGGVGLMLTFFLNDLKAGAIYAEFGWRLLEKVSQPKLVESHTIFMTHAFVLHMTRPVHDVLKMLLKGYEIGLETGDIEHAMFNIHFYILMAFQSGKPLSAIEADCRIYTKQMKEFDKGRMFIPCSLLWQAVLNLMGSSNNTTTLTGQAIDQDDFLKDYSHDKYSVSFYQVYQTQLYALFGEHELGAELALSKGELSAQTPGSPCVVTDTFFKAVSLFSMARKTKKRKYSVPAKKALATIKGWVEQGNPNVMHFALLLEAEKSALKCRDKSQTKEEYEEAIRRASRTGFAQDAAFANERYAEYLLHDVGDHEEAAFRFREATNLYREWGASQKIVMISEQYGHLFSPPTQIELSGSEHELGSTFHDSSHPL